MCNRFADRLNLFSGIISNADVELFFELHDQLDSVKRVCAKIVYEVGLEFDFFFINTKLFSDDVFYAFFDRCHIYRPPSL